MAGTGDASNWCGAVGDADLSKRRRARRTVRRDGRVATFRRGGALRGVAPHGSGLSRRRARRVLALIDTVHGRYLLVTKPNLDCARWTTVLPGTERATRNAVAELLAEAQPRQESWLS